MKYETLFIDKKEYELLKRIISMSQHHRDKTYKGSIDKLFKELQKAKIVSNSKMPVDVIRLNSEVTVAIPDLRKKFQIVTPEKSNLKLGKISILAPMGLALFGYAKGDEIEWEFPSGANIIKILDVIQHPQIFKSTGT